VVASAQEVTSWPHDADHSPELSIGRVVDALKDEFPAISLSKVRYLESEGLVSPARTGSGDSKRISTSWLFLMGEMSRPAL